MEDEEVVRTEIKKAVKDDGVVSHAGISGLLEVAPLTSPALRDQAIGASPMPKDSSAVPTTAGNIAFSRQG